MKSPRNIFSLISGLAIIAGSFSPLSAALANKHLPTNLREALEKVTEISEIANDATLTGAEKSEKELYTRKEALTKIFALTLLEDQELKNKLVSLQNLSPEHEEVRSLLLNIFTENENAYRVMKKRLDEAAALEDVKQLAADFKNWRNAVYNPKVEQIVAFVLVFQQDKTLITAEGRFRRIKADLEKLEKAKLIKKEDFDMLLQKSLLHVTLARELNNRAQRMVITNMKEELVLADDQTQQILSATEPAAPGEEQNPKDLAGQSIDQIKLAYKNFLEIGKIVLKKIAK